MSTGLRIQPGIPCAAGRGIGAVARRIDHRLDNQRLRRDAGAGAGVSGLVTRVVPKTRASDTPVPQHAKFASTPPSPTI